MTTGSATTPRFCRLMLSTRARGNERSCPKRMPMRFMTSFRDLGCGRPRPPGEPRIMSRGAGGRGDGSTEPLFHPGQVSLGQIADVPGLTNAVWLAGVGHHPGRHALSFQGVVELVA